MITLNVNKGIYTSLIRRKSHLLMSVRQDSHQTDVSPGLQTQHRTVSA